MIIQLKDTKNPNYIRLGFISVKDLDYKIVSWAPKSAKSYTILRIIDSDSIGKTAIVQYYTTLKEGKVKMQDIVQQVVNEGTYKESYVVMPWRKKFNI